MKFDGTAGTGETCPGVPVVSVKKIYVLKKICKHQEIIR